MSVHSPIYLSACGVWLLTLGCVDVICHVAVPLMHIRLALMRQLFFTYLLAHNSTLFLLAVDYHQSPKAFMQGTGEDIRGNG